MTRIIGVDVGGTFTDVVDFDGDVIAGRKVPTTPSQADGVVGTVAGDPSALFLHGTTAATNALLEESGVDVVFVTDQGYEDLIEIGRQERPALYDNSIDRPSPLVAREARLGFGGDIDELVERIGSLDAEAVAVGLIESYLDDSVERSLTDRISEAAGIPVLRSSEISPEFREYERFATTILAAYLTPSVAGYLQALDSRIAMSSRLIMTSSGGLLPFSAGHASAGRLILSGPAGGAVAAAELGRHHGHETVLSFDMGGTSTDVCRITSGNLAVGSGHSVGGRINRVPAVPIRTIGAGGGSIAWRDPGGSLRVGPRSAGSAPGPASYGHGGVEPTVTDANLIVGNIPAGLELGGSVPLNRELAEQAIGALADGLGLSVEATAHGILEVVDSHMEHALRSVSVEEGADPREAVLVAFGGAGGLHATKLAARLGISKVLIPPLSGVFSALGLLLAQPRTDAATTVMMKEGDDRLMARLTAIESEAVARFEAIFSSPPSSTSASADMRYRGQSHELEISASSSWDVLRVRFEQAHLEAFGFSRVDEPIELVNLRAVSNGQAPIAWDDLPRVATSGESVGENGVWQRASLPAGAVLEGPCLVVETNSAILVEAGDTLAALDDGTLEITKARDGRLATDG